MRYRNNELYHHGILGQRWGVRNGPPYPLDAKRHSASERKAGWRKSLDKTGDTTYNKVKASGVNSDSEKHIAVGKSVIERIFKEKTTINESGVLRRIPKESISEAVSKVNPTDSRTNCRACSIASILRMRGYDAVARGDVGGGTIDDAVKTCFLKSKIVDIMRPTKDRICNYILRHYENGASGIIGVELSPPYGTYQHAFNWMVEDGSVRFFDGQKNQHDASRYMNWVDGSRISAQIARLDHLEIDADGIANYIQNSK